MSGSVNKVTILGNLGRDPEIRRTASGDPVANLNVATSESWRDKTSGERKERTEWHKIVVLNSGLTKIIEQYLHKGSKVYLEGQLQTRKWTDKDGVERYVTEVVVAQYRGVLVLLDGNRGDAGQQSHAPDAASTANDSGFDDSDIPF